MKIVGVDYGTKRIGVAVSDERGMFAFPKMTLPNDNLLIADLSAFLKKEKAVRIVVGESKNLSGEDNPVMRDVRRFAKELAGETGLPIEFEPEFYTSVEARRLKGTNGPVDAEAAAIILESYLKKNTSHDDLT